MKYRHIHIEETTSTNLIARNMETEDDETVVITTDFQTDGKGQGSNKWERKKEKNLLFSIITPTLSIESRKQFLISMAMVTVRNDIGLLYPHLISCAIYILFIMLICVGI